MKTDGRRHTPGPGRPMMSNEVARLVRGESTRRATNDPAASGCARSAARPRLSTAFTLLAFFASTAVFALGQDLPASDPGAGWGMPQPGDRCLVCGELSSPDTILVHRGRRVTILGAVCLAAWREDPARYFARLQGRGALVDEQQVNVGRRLGYVWFLGGLYVLLGLVCGAMAACKAVARGRHAMNWFALGMLVNVVALAAQVIITAREDDHRLAQLAGGLPRGLTKPPATHPPATCPGCGAGQHPSASSCSGCGAVLEPVVESEVARLGRTER